MRSILIVLSGVFLLGLVLSCLRFLIIPVKLLHHLFVVKLIVTCCINPKLQNSRCLVLSPASSPSSPAHLEVSSTTYSFRLNYTHHSFRHWPRHLQSPRRPRREPHPCLHLGQLCNLRCSTRRRTLPETLDPRSPSPRRSRYPQWPRIAHRAGQGGVQPSPHRHPGQQCGCGAE